MRMPMSDAICCRCPRCDALLTAAAARRWRLEPAGRPSSGRAEAPPLMRRRVKQMSASAVGSAGMSENRRARRRFAAIAALGAVQRRPLPDRGADADAMLRPGQTDPVIWVSRRTRGPVER